jgi:hypothetical protein
MREEKKSQHLHCSAIARTGHDLGGLGDVCADEVEVAHEGVQVHERMRAVERLQCRVQHSSRTATANQIVEKACVPIGRCAFLRASSIQAKAQANPKSGVIKMIDALVEVRLVRLGLAHRHKLALGCAVVVDAVVAIDTRNTLGDAADDLKEQFSIIRFEEKGMQPFAMLAHLVYDGFELHSQMGDGRGWIKVCAVDGEGRQVVCALRDPDCHLAHI